MTSCRKLVEVALPLDAINAACKADKDRKTGTIRNLHKWFAPMPLPAWRALLFATLVDDPGEGPERDRLFKVIEALVASGGDPPPSDAIAAAQREIARCWPDGPPPVLDPFCGGGSTLIEAQRIGCTTIGSDLNPIPVLITRTLTDLIPKAIATEPVVPSHTFGLQGDRMGSLANDIRHYAAVVRESAWAQVAAAFAGQEDAIAWLWCRTVRCPNPACGVLAPLVDSFWLSKKQGEQVSLHVRFAAGAKPGCTA